MKNSYRFTSILFFFLSGTLLPAQISFKNDTNLLAGPGFHSGVAIGVVDMNGDGLDDIVRLSQGRILNFEFQNSAGTGFTNYLFGPVSSDSQWSICIADVDNNGFNDVLTGGAYDEVKLIVSAASNGSYEMSHLPGPQMFLQGSNFADINNDGFVDIFACHDDGESRIWRNDSTGNFVQADEWIDMATVPPSDNSGNYGSIWTDFDNDGDLDLYITKCRQGVDDPQDPRRLNALFINDGNGNYTEMADTFGLKIGAQSWTSDFQDIDNDGDLDCLITNHDLPSMLLENDGSGHFTDITASSGMVVTGLPIQGIMRDFDNDGFVDILVSGSRQNLFRNNGDRTFTRLSGVFDANDMESIAVGDLNHDGFPDVYAGYAEIFTNPSDIDDVLWMNEGNSNHFLTVNLMGDSSNRNGIGSRLEIFGEWGIQTREVRSGESYGIMNSFTQHFGLGSSSFVDSLIVRWPSGIVDKYEALAANQFLTLIENNCISPDAAITALGPTTFCTGDSIVLQAPEGYDYQWSNGDSLQSIAVGEPGTYRVTISDDSNCIGVSAPIGIIVDPQEIPDIIAEGDTVFCLGGSVSLSTGESADYLWSTGETTQSILVGETGLYFVTTSGLCDDFSSEEISVNVLEAMLPEATGDTLQEVGVAVLTALGSSLFWYDLPEGGSPISEGDTLYTPFITESTTYYVENRESFFGGTDHAGPEEHNGPSLYSGNIYNGQIIFDCLSPFTLKTVKVYTDTPGQRVIELRDADDNVLAGRQVDIPLGESIVQLDLDVQPGTDLILTTNAQNNADQFGFNSPRLQRSESISGYPFLLEGVLTLKTSNFGDNWYYYFYNWEIQKPSIVCTSERVTVEAVVGEITATNDPVLQASFSIYPNPAKKRINIELGIALKGYTSLKILDMSGVPKFEKILDAGERNAELDLAHLAKGMYIVELNSEKGTLYQKFILQ